MFTGSYPTAGWRLWLFLTGLFLIALLGVLLEVSVVR
jgi:hypothetical protein